MTWEILKKEIYYFDGALLDIYVLNATKQDWSKWTKYVNDSYKLNFYNYQTNSYENKIALDVLADYWNDRNESSDIALDATIKLETIDIKCHFFDDTQIENDFDPGDIITIEDHNRIVNYLTDIANLLGKTVIVTPENTPDFILISANLNEVKINVF